MAKTKISEFSSTPGNNTDIDGINIAEGCAPSGINDAIRELMAQLKDFQAGDAGDSITVVGTLAAKGTSSSGADLKLYEDTDNGTNYVGFMAPASIASNVQWTLPSADGTANQVLSTNGSGVLSWASGGNVSTSANNAFTGANTFYNATGQTFGTATSSEDGIIVAGRAGGSSSYRVTLTPGTLTASRTVTFPDASTTVPIATQVLTFSGPTAARTITLPDANTVVPTISQALTFSGPTAARTITLPDANTTVPTISQALTFSGPTAARTITLPDASFTAARTDAGQTFTGTQTILAASTQDAIALAGRAGGTSSYVATITPATLSASRTVTLPDGGGNYTLGYRNLPAVGTKTGSYTLAVADIGKYVQVGSGGSITIPDATFAEGDAISIFNNTTGNITITCSITTAYIAGTDSDKATMTLATRGVATVLFISSTVCVVSGNVT
jgi:hypothetical protein